MFLWHVIFSPKAEKQLKSLDRVMQQRIKHKLDYFCSLLNPQVYAEVLVDFEHWTYRYRIGDYCVIVDIDERGKLIIVAIIGHRGEIYK